MPDINSLPPSPSPSASSSHPARIMSSSSADPARNMSPSPTSHTPPHSLAAAAAMNAGIQSEDLRRTSSGSMRRDVERARRRSSIRMNLNLNDPALPAPGEMQSPSGRSRAPWPHSPHHERTPSLGELHQELEYEQEGQVNRLLNMIRQQQVQIQVLQTNQQQPSTSAVDDSTPTSERSPSIPQSAPGPQAHISQVAGNVAPPRTRSPFGNISRQSSMADRSRRSSHANSPALRPMSGVLASHDTGDWLPASATGVPRDEGAFYQAETQNLTRENQMLKQRIRELERQLTDLNPTSSVTHSPATSSSLHTSPSVSRRDTQPMEGTESTGPGS